MTLEELSQLYHLRCEIADERRRLAELKSKAYAASSPNLSGMPGRKGGDKVARYATDIERIEKIIEGRIARCDEERCKLEQYIAQIPDSLTRRVFTFRFVENLSWTAVAMRIGGGVTDDCVKKICYRYIGIEK